MKQHFSVSDKTHIFGAFEARSEQHAKDLCAQQIGYLSESDMELKENRTSELEAIPAFPWFVLEEKQS